MTEFEIWNTYRLGIKKRIKAATKGPWIAHQDPDDPDRCLGIGHGRPGGIYKKYEEEIITTDSGVYPPRMNDALFIAHARTDLPNLIKRIETLEKLIRQIKW